MSNSDQTPRGLSLHDSHKLQSQWVPFELVKNPNYEVVEGGREVGREREPVYYWYKGQVISALMLGIIGYWGSIRVHR